MFVLALVFIAVAISRFVPKISILAVSSAVLVASFTVLALCNADRMIAKYNVDRYINGTISTVDVMAMEELGDAATPELIKLAEYMDKEKGADIIKNAKRGYFSFDENMEGNLINILSGKKDAMENSEKGLFSFTLNSIMAEKAMKEAEIIK